MDKFVIAVTRTCGSGATSISRLLAQRYGIHMYDRNLLRLASEDSGINEALFAKADENVKKSLLYKVSRKIYKGELIPPESDDFTSNDNLFNYQAKILKELANEESYICIGRAADYILKDYKNVIRIFIYAPFEKCVEKEITRLGLSEKEAIKHVRDTDKYRSDYYKYHTGRVWKDPYNYDLCLNTGELTYEQCASLIEEYIKRKMKYD